MIKPNSIWFHSFKFDDGEEIDGVIPYKILKDRESLLSKVDMVNKTVLDIGCWDGYYSAYAAKVGASNVMGIDVGPWNSKSWEDKFDYVMYKNKLTNVNRKTISVYDVGGSPFDVVMFMGVLYHLKHPLLALENVRKITSGKMIIETYISCQDVGYPAMKFYPGKELNNDPTNWWAPNITCLEDMLKTVGFSKLEIVGDVPKTKDGRIIIICE